MEMYGQDALGRRRMLEALKKRGASVDQVTLHIGPGTFLPVSATDTAQHKMHPEWEL
jgi:S-adenosylmethionine:tRNA ribosyltransferase-isomerase